MSRPALNIHSSPQEVAETLLKAHAGEPAWLDAFAEYLDRKREGHTLSKVLEVWGLSQAEAARVFGVSRQAVGKWLDKGVPPERQVSIADLAAASDLLVRYLKRERIPAVVRRPAEALGRLSLLELLAQQGSGAVLSACREMFDLHQLDR